MDFFWSRSLSTAKTILASDWPLEAVDAVFLFGHSFKDEDGLFEIAADFHARGATVVINGSRGEDRTTRTPNKAWEGADAWSCRLHTFGVKEVLRTRPAFDTKDENEAFLEVAVGRRWRSAVLLTQPYRAVRSLLGQLKSMADHDYKMKIYVVAPRSTNWWKEVCGSQGIQLLPRFRHIEAEDERIFRYQCHGEYSKDRRDLATFEELFEYLKRRENIR